ncbi:MAG: hypothetical protein AVDCRST_MAG45-553, partial [uncultured Solirubrobacterales bacterium]
ATAEGGRAADTSTRYRSARARGRPEKGEERRGETLRAEGERFQAGKTGAVVDCPYARRRNMYAAAGPTPDNAESGLSGRTGAGNPRAASSRRGESSPVCDV